MSAVCRLREWREFLNRVEARMAAGAREYGEASFARDPEDLCDEIRQEIEDVCGWAFILWCRVRDIERHNETRSTPSSG
jgi:hypothetical protein